LQTIAKNGYLYVYVSNESQQDVYFDDLNVKHYTGPLVQEQSYYPFGLQMAGISDKALNKLSSQYKFNGGVELEEDFGVNLYSTFFRQYDPQLGRFSGVDILSQQSHGLSPYQFGLNNPIHFNDPLGDRAVAMGDIERMWNSPNGGHWSSGSGVELFGSQDDAFMFGALQMEQNSMWGGGSGWAGSFGEALGRYNGGNITEGMVAGFYKATWGNQATNISAKAVSGGFNVAFTATSSGNSYSDYFVTAESITSSFGFLQGLYGNRSAVLQAGFGFSEFTASTELALAALRPSYIAAASLAKHGVPEVPLFLKKNVFASPLLRNNNALYLGRISSSAAKNGAAVMKYAGPGLTFLAVGTTAYDILKDGKISVGEGFQAVNTALQIIFPVYGVFYGLVDLGFSIFTDRSLTDRIKTGIDSY
jgi:RHS repeat-associated protein